MERDIDLLIESCKVSERPRDLDQRDKANQSIEF